MRLSSDSRFFMERFARDLTIKLNSATNEQINLDHDTKGWSSEASSDDDDDGSMLFDPSQSDVSSTTEESDVRKRESGCEEPSQPSHPRPSNWRRPPSPNHADPDFLCRRDLKGRNGEEIDRRLPLRPYNPDMIAAKNALCAKRDWSQCAGNEDSELWEKRYRIQRMDDEELRNRLLDCEASIERWERAFNRQTLILQSTVEETRQLKRSRSFWDFSSMRHCGCDCPRNGNMGNTG